MYRVVIEDKDFNRLAFKFASMEEVSVFVETVLRAAEKELIVKIDNWNDEKEE